jgi:hypothetical protein
MENIHLRAGRGDLSAAGIWPLAGNFPSFFLRSAEIMLIYHFNHGLNS